MRKKIIDLSVSLEIGINSDPPAALPKLRGDPKSLLPVEQHAEQDRDCLPWRNRFDTSLAAFPLDERIVPRGVTTKLTS